MGARWHAERTFLGPYSHIHRHMFSLKSRSLGWASHVVRMGRHWNKFFFVGKYFGKRRRVYEDNIKMDLTKIACNNWWWTEVARGCVQWRALLPDMFSHSLVLRGPFSFSPCVPSFRHLIFISVVQLDCHFVLHVSCPTLGLLCKNDARFVAQLVKKFPAFYRSRRFITVFTTARHWSRLTFHNNICC